MKKVIVQRWEESERGWGTRPDGYTLHLKEEHIKVILDKMREAEFKIYKGATPDEYTRPDGKPYVGLIEDELYEKVAKSEFGIWGPNGNKYPPEVSLNDQCD